MAIEKDAKIYVAGHRGMVGSALVRRLESLGFDNIVKRTSDELDLRNQEAVDRFFANELPDAVFLAAARVGGIIANKQNPAEFLYDNSMMELNVIHAAAKYNCRELLFVGSVCVYPRHAPQPIKEESLLTGPFEPLDEGYAVAKLLGLKYCDYLNKQYGLHYVSVMPTNLYGPHDNYNPKNSHVLPGMIQRFHEAKVKSCDEVVVWGTGKPTREFLYVDDFADACIFILNNHEGPGTISVGTGVETSIAELADCVKEVVGFEGRIVYDLTKPDGTPKRYLDISKLNSLGWKSSTNLMDGIKSAYEDFLKGNIRINRSIEGL